MMNRGVLYIVVAVIVCTSLYFKDVLFRREISATDNIGKATVNIDKAIDTVGNVITRTDSTWRINTDVCVYKEDFVLAHLRMPPKTPIFVYSARIDRHVSASIISRGHYEGPWVNKIYNLMKQYPKAIFIDIGSNIGMFSVTISALGYRVIAIDCLDDNVMRLCASMKTAKLSDKLTIIYNAVSDKHEKVTLGKYDGDVGGTFIKQYAQEEKKYVETICLDDLLDIYNLEQVIIKMDVEKAEDKVLKGANKFFQRVRVEALLMEFIKHKNSPSGQFIVDFLSYYGLEPEVPRHLKNNYNKWQDNNILFKRKK